VAGTFTFQELPAAPSEISRGMLLPAEPLLRGDLRQKEEVLVEVERELQTERVTQEQRGWRDNSYRPKNYSAILRRIEPITNLTYS